MFVTPALTRPRGPTMDVGGWLRGGLGLDQYEGKFRDNKDRRVRAYRSELLDTSPRLSDCPARACCRD